MREIFVITQTIYIFATKIKNNEYNSSKILVAHLTTQKVVRDEDHIALLQHKKIH